MPFWGRIVLFAAGIGIAAIDGLEPSAGVPDFIGGALLVVALVVAAAKAPRTGLATLGVPNPLQWAVVHAHGAVSASSTRSDGTRGSEAI
jgi:hypothetical protein